MKGNGKSFIYALLSDGGDLATAVSKLVTKIVRHYDEDERQPDGSLRWDTLRPVLLRAFAQQGARDFSENWVTSKTRILLGLQEFLVIFEQFRDTLCVFQ